MNALKLWYKRNHCALWVLFLCLLLSGLLSISVRAEAPTQTISVPVTQWNELKSNNEKALNLINVSEVPLTEAQSLIYKQANELTELKSINAEQAKTLAQAKSDLAKQEVYLSETQNSLDQLNKQIKKNHDAEKRLTRQRNTWAYIAGVLVVGLAVK